MFDTEFGIGAKCQTFEEPTRIYEGAQNVLGLNNLWIAGEAFPTKGEDNGWVDAAAFLGDDAAKQILQLQSDGTDKNNKDDKTEFWEKVAADAELRRRKK